MDKLPSCDLPVAPGFVERFAAALGEAVTRSGWKFQLQDSTMTSEEATAPDGLLSVWVDLARAAMREGLDGQEAPMGFRAAPESVCSVVPEPAETSASLGVWLCFTHCAIERWRQQQIQLNPAYATRPIPVDALYDRWHERLRSHDIPYSPARAPAQFRLEGQPPHPPSPVISTAG